MIRPAITGVVAALALAVSGCARGPEAPAKFFEVAPAIPGEYIVVLPGDVSADAVAGQADALVKSYGGHVTHRYAEPRGFAVAGMRAARARALANDPRVRYVEQAASASTAWRDKSPGWALDRIDQRSGTSGDYRYSADGEGVRVYVLDTGVEQGHPAFLGTRVTFGFDATDPNGTGAPCDRHGTSMAGLIAGGFTGVAPRAEIVNVKVLDCNPIGGNGIPDLVAGIDWVAAHAVAPAVVNLSWQLRRGVVSPTLRTAIANLVAKDVVVVAAAGNDNDDVAQAEPANYPGVLTVGGSVAPGDRWVNSGSPATGCPTAAGECGSNFGPGVDLFAPASANTADLGGGFNIPPPGTSEAAALVSGAAAATLQAFRSPPKPGVGQLTTPSEEAIRILLANATPGAVSDLRGSPDRFLYTETWPVSIERLDLPGVRGPTAVASSPSAGGSTPSIELAAGLPDRFAASPAPNGDPYAAQVFDGDTPRWPAPPALLNGGCADIEELNVAHLWLACTRVTTQVPQGRVRAVNVADGSTAGESTVGAGLGHPAAGATICNPAQSVARAVSVDPNGAVYVGGDTWCGAGVRSGFLTQLVTLADHTLWQERIFDQGNGPSAAFALAAGSGVVTVAGMQSSTARIEQFSRSGGASTNLSFSPAIAAPSAAFTVSQDRASGRIYASAQDANGAGFVYALSSGLSKQWEQRLDGARINAVAALKDGVLVAGVTTRGLPFWPVTNPLATALVGRPLASPRGFLMRYDEAGTLRWTHYIDDAAVVGLTAEGRAELGDSVLADIAAVKPALPCPPGGGVCLQPANFVESFRIK